MFDVAAILINYNSSAYTIECIKSIVRETDSKISLQIIVTDNASEIEDFNKLKTFIDTCNIPNISLTRSLINTGFGGGNQHGVQIASAKYLAFINNDTILQNDCLKALKSFMDKTPQAGVCGPQGFKEDGSMLPTIDHFASLTRELLNRRLLEIVNPKKYPTRKKLYKQPVRAQFVAGSFMFFRASDYNSIGGFDTNIFLYYEETDICSRLLKINKYAYLVPDGKFMHYHGVSTPKAITTKMELKLSLLYVIRKHDGFLAFLLLLIYMQMTYFVKSIFKPKYWQLWYLLLLGAPLSKSLKHKQKILAF